CIGGGSPMEPPLRFFRGLRNCRRISRFSLRRVDKIVRPKIRLSPAAAGRRGEEPPARGDTEMEGFEVLYVLLELLYGQILANAIAILMVVLCLALESRRSAFIRSAVFMGRPV